MPPAPCRHPPRCIAAADAGAGPASSLIVNASIVDGTGRPQRAVSVRITGDRIAAVGALLAAPTDRVVDAQGLTLAPGFIDTHSHHDRGLLDQRDALAAVSQGISTIVVGQDAGSAYSLQDFFDRLPCPNQAPGL